MIKKTLRSSQNGFTLIELIIVLTLIGILVGLAIPQYQNATRRAREARLKSDLFTLRTLINQYFTDKGKYPASLQTIVEENYLVKIPVDPMTDSSETWVEIRESPPPEEIEPGTVLGVVDVRSGSTRKALDGTLYNTW